jgi:periplasmic nitrate reductase NapD
MPINPTPSPAADASARRTPEIHISSLVIQHSPAQTNAIQAAASAINGLEWCVSENGKAVVTLVTSSAGAVMDRIAALNALPGVHTTTMVYHHYESADAIDGPAAGPAASHAAP